mgnify:CR=1 FL=1
MAIHLRVGVVMDTADITNTGIFYASFDAASSPEPVTYVSPYASPTGGVVFIPPVLSRILAFYNDDPSKDPSILGYYYVGSIMGSQPGENYGVPTNLEKIKKPENPSYTPSDQLGFNYPVTISPISTIAPALLDTFYAQKSAGAFPLQFKGLYEAKSISPQQMGIATEEGDGLLFSNRKNDISMSDNPFQDYRVSLKTGKGKRLELVDSPIVNGLTYQNENTGLDYLVWCSKGNVNSPFSKGEFHMRTHGPVNLYTLWSSFRIWVQNGKNLDIENKSGDTLAFNIAKFPRKSDGRTDTEGNIISGLGDPGSGAYSKTRKGNFGNRSTGCVNITSHRNDVVVKALNPDSIVQVYAPGVHSKVIIEAGGSVDIVAKGKITLQSDTEVEINAPLVDINGANKGDTLKPSGEITIDGGSIKLNDPIHNFDGY